MKDVEPKDIIEAGKLAVKLTQGFNLVGEPKIVGQSLIIADHDENPKFTIHIDGSKIVEFAYSDNIRTILVAGAMRYIEEAGYQCIHQVQEKKHPLETLLRGIKDKIGEDLEVVTIRDADDDDNLKTKKH